MSEIYSESLQKPFAAQTGRTFKDLWEISVTRVNETAENKRARREENMKRFIDEVTVNAEEIPVENRIAPKDFYVDPILKEAENYLEIDEHRHMFAAMLAKSMDKRYLNDFRLSFVDIIKQLTPRDAENLANIAKNKRDNKIYNIELFDEAQSPAPAYKYEGVYIGKKANFDLDSQILSLNALKSLGLMIYNIGAEKFMASCNREYNLDSIFLQKYNDADIGYIINHIPYEISFNFTLKFVRGLIFLTPLGNSFVKVCL
ncbi:MAG: DUF4393 domain-containing protein [Oscillospiraceae bacterium]|nr:DUF4393 domain-containing protein [Oscillospiraceae bacterium]